MTQKKHSLRVALAASLLLLGLTAAQAEDAFTCAKAPDPVVSLSYESRYTDESVTRADIDPDADAATDLALEPIDNFLRDLTRTSNTLFPDPGKKKAKKSGDAKPKAEKAKGDKPENSGPNPAEIADCVVGQIAVWARAGALLDLRTPTARLTIGARVAGFGLVLLQALPQATQSDDIAVVKAWLGQLVRNQMVFWEEEAPNGSRQGNLRAWAALAAAASAQILDDPVMRGWSAWSVRYILCKAAPDGSLPQEMRRGHFALKYQLHAIAPLVVTTLLLKRQGIDLRPACDNALARVVGFATADLDTGSATQAITGEVQSFFDGTDTLKAFHLAWIEPYLLLAPKGNKRVLLKLAEQYRPLNYSKLGGKQAVIWQEQR